MNRGGDLTYHEPGQLVGYIILDLKKEKLSVRDFLSKIENLIINSLKKAGINASKHPELVGVWLDGKKIASIGIGIKKGVTMHGFALNVNNELEGFKKINPCGLNPEEISSLKKIKKQEFSPDLIKKLLINQLQEEF